MSSEIATPKRLGILAAVVAVAALVFGSVQSTGAMWRDAAAVNAGTVKAGELTFTVVDGSTQSVTFTSLAGPRQVLTQSVRAPLRISNAGNIPLRYHLVSAGPTVTTASTVGVTLAGSVGGSCTTALGTTSAFTPLVGVTAVSNAVSPFRTLQPGASETWCIQTTLISVSGTQPADYKHVFTFRAEQAKFAT